MSHLSSASTDVASDVQQVKSYQGVGSYQCVIMNILSSEMLPERETRSERTEVYSPVVDISPNIREESNAGSGWLIFH